MTRVPYLTRDDLPSDKRDLYDQVAAHRGHVARPFAALLNSPEVASRVAMIGEQLRYVSTTLSSDAREIVTLTTARILKCQYVWTHHCDSARQAGVREEVVEAIREGGPAPASAAQGGGVRPVYTGAPGRQASQGCDLQRNRTPVGAAGSCRTDCDDRLLLNALLGD